MHAWLFLDYSLLVFSPMGNLFGLHIMVSCCFFYGTVYFRFVQNFNFHEIDKTYGACFQLVGGSSLF